MNTPLNVVGKTVARTEASLKAAGLTEYTADHCPPEALTLKVLRSPHAHARVRSIDASRVEALGGVAAVATAADLPRNRIGRWLYDRSIFAWEKVRHVGEAVAAVAAVDEETAEKALSLFKVEYEVLPGVFDPLKAVEPESVLVHEDMAGYTPTNRDCQGNILLKENARVGDVSAAFQQADLIYEARYATAMGHSGFTQPHQCVASVDTTGKLTLWTSTKDPFGIRKQVSQALGLPMSAVRVIAGMCGGDFGGKGSITIEGICACLARKTRRPVSLSLDWHEELGATFVRNKSIIDLQIGVTTDGAVLGVKARVIHDCGAYMDAMGSNLGEDLAALQGPYRCPNVDLSAVLVYTNNPPTGHVRGVRCPAESFAIESHIDGVARKLGLDPIEMRLRNLMQDGDRLCTGAILRNVGAKTVLEKAAGYLEKQRGPREAHAGWGIAMGQYNMHALPGGLKMTSATVRINDDGTVNLLTGSTEQGSGIVTVLQQIVAEELGVAMDSMSVVCADTDTSPWERGTGASDTTYRVGAMVQMAARDARDQLLLLAAKRLDTDPGNLAMAGGRVFKRDAPQISVALKEIAREAASSNGGPITGTGLSQRNERFSRIEAEKGIIDGPSYGVVVAKVKVDPDTGKVTVPQCYSVWDVGFALNPSNVEGQIEGGVACGIGYALSEEMVLREGRTLNNSIVNYHMPTASDTPRILTGVVEVPSTWGPYGAKGFGEGTNAPVAPAIANAMFEATGVRLKELPLTPERVFMGLKNHKQDNVS